MMVANRGSVLRLLHWQWRNVALFTATSTVVAIAHEVLDLHWLTIPAFPVVVIGTALGIFVSFRTNSAYDRWWEGRKLWGALVNASRHFATQVLAYLPAGEDGLPTALQRRLVHRHVAYVHTLRCLLRRQMPSNDLEVTDRLEEIDRPLVATSSNATHALLDRQLRELAEQARAGVLDERRLQSFDGTVRSLLDVQGGCERIKNTPMPRGYAFIADQLTLVYAALFPFALAEELGWLIIPVNVLVCLAFALISETGRVLEDPFSMFFNGLPLSALSRTIEINLRERLGEAPLPPMLSPDDRGILM